jgi:hypothetical protein
MQIYKRFVRRQDSSEINVQAAALILQGDNYLKEGDSIAAIELFKKGLALYQKNAESNAEEISEVYAYLAAAHIQQGKSLLERENKNGKETLHSAIAHLEAGIKYYEENKGEYKEKIKEVYSLLAAAHVKQGSKQLRNYHNDFTKGGIEHINQAIELYKKADNEEKLQETYWHLGDSYCNRAEFNFYPQSKDFDNVLEYLSRAKLSARNSGRYAASLYYTIADIYLKCWERDKAIECLDEAIASPDDYHTLDAYIGLIKCTFRYATKYSNAAKRYEYFSAGMNRFAKLQLQCKETQILAYYHKFIELHPNWIRRDQDFYLFLLEITALILSKGVSVEALVAWKYSGRYFYELATALSAYSKVAAKFASYPVSFTIPVLKGLLTIPKKYNGDKKDVTAKLEQLLSKEEATFAKHTNRTSDTCTQHTFSTEITYLISMQRR